MNKSLTELAHDVCDEKSFLDFARALASDRLDSEEAEKRSPSNPYGPQAGGWENGTIYSFLECAVSWAEDSDFGKIPASNPWKRFAVFLWAGKFYE